MKKNKSIPSQMTTNEIESLKTAVEGLHKCKASYKEITPVKETYRGDLVWDGGVYVFDLEGHPTTKTAYAWSSPIEGSDKRKFYAVLHEGPVKTPADAVRAAIVKDYQESESK